MAHPVRTPAHYTQHKIEQIEYSQHLSGCLFSAFKYLWRYEDKENPVQDLSKAIWYLNRERKLHLQAFVSFDVFPSISELYYMHEKNSRKAYVLECILCYANSLEEIYLLEALRSTARLRAWARQKLLDNSNEMEYNHPSLEKETP